MCGILFSAVPALAGDDSVVIERFNQLYERLQAANASRGPDAQDTVVLLEENCRLSFTASELRLRGESFVSQPHRDEQGNILCWNGEIFDGIEVSSTENDGEQLFSLLRNLQTPAEIRDCMGSIEGPYAFVYYQQSTQTLYFGRDPLGRRSLLIHRPTREQPHFVLTSVSVGSHPSYVWEELSTEHLYAIDVTALSLREDARIEHINRLLPDDPLKVQHLDGILPHLVTAVDGLIDQLDRSVMLRVRDIPKRGEASSQARVAVLFSGGIDSTMLAFLASRHADPSEPIDLLNVAFENPRKITVKVEGNIGGLPKRERKQKLREGLDYSAIEISYDVPDRLTGLQEVEELRRLCPGRTWNFVEINVPFEESRSARPIVEAIMYPSRTVMDLSLAMALYFAARGVGEVRSGPAAQPVPYTSTARVLLNGLGSDELMGGYGRFRTAFKHGGWQAIVDELQLELDRIPIRNLGRDDRVISSQGKETRHPFLSLSVVSFLAQLPVHLKVDPRLESGLGEKLLLRLAARKVGLVEASARKKRAMQFGSHSARMAPGEGDKHGELLIR
ncbi:asparagine synthase-domain-containing protein [Rhodofomes roseus]|uniref:Asparagine synthase-domain-containing protein n=1 Tax=Rhodofomes roseus TaxID=34475 RepID=A0ABQ8KDK5_9APHY|nr:asparagine synthase-domain-containing protein [Rhodofomes roseus]KAH9835729.1 asparagine synthase-domain-containing protein [Rhodofomes roseus]